MKNFLKCLLIIFFILTFQNNLNSTEKNSYFIGHAYGKHGNIDIPDNSLKNFLEKYKANFIIFGGDLTEKKENFNIFYDYFRNTKFLAVRGNHDGDLFNKIPFWRSEKINGFSIYNLDMSQNMDFDKRNLENLKNNLVIQHYVWFLRLFSDLPHNLPNKKRIDKIFYKIKLFNSIQIPIANSMYESKILERGEIKKINFGNNNVYIAGDCGAYEDRFSYVKSYYNNNTFICSGIGSGWANNVIDLNTLEPIFFDINGNIVDHNCKEILGRLDNIIQFCLPNHPRSKNLWDFLIKETS